MYIAAYTLTIEAIKRQGFHPPLKSAIKGCLLALAAILFVDNTDQIHLSKDEQPKDMFIQHIQNVITFWGILVLATESISSNLSVGWVCHTSVCEWKTRLKKLSELPNTLFTIP